MQPATKVISAHLLPPEVRRTASAGAFPFLTLYRLLPCPSTGVLHQSCARSLCSLPAAAQVHVPRQTKNLKPFDLRLVVENCPQQSNLMCSASTVDSKERWKRLLHWLEPISDHIFPCHRFHKSTVFFRCIIAIHIKMLTGHKQPVQPRHGFIRR